MYIYILKKNIIKTLFIFIFLSGLLITSVQTGIPKSFLETKNKRGDIIHKPLEPKQAEPTTPSSYMDVEESQPLRTEIDETQKKQEGQQVPISNSVINQDTMAEAGGFACGPDAVCDRATQYCFVVFGGPAGVPPGYQCADLPGNCPSPPTCECIPFGIGSKCTESDGGITVTTTAP